MELSREEISDEGVELKSPFPVIPPVKDSKWNELPKSADAESQPLKPPVLYPDIGEPHPYPYFIGPDLIFIKPKQAKKKEITPPPPPIVPATIPPPLPIESPT
ncbi:glyceraldehyde-3-phosphate dehydrogenase, testis-specific-like [Stegodyphus dumicola]|uniref:glyceraldehyde-3-phosphate dehydrogenase, testis-specific-like n=1 Tax=Stegodyphus dumicola TaxID=202533 RepID=UPI0015B31172|nr:glyceraldehyde-3-phosphate dehydrogenase, testis-specific-like [Stegodyphus dumicola]